MFCDADFEGGICCNPGSNPAVLRIQGITTPEEQNFAVYDPGSFYLLYFSRRQKLRIHAEILDTEPWYQHPVG